MASDTDNDGSKRRPRSAVRSDQSSDVETLEDLGLVQAYLEGELSPTEVQAVEALLSRSEPAVTSALLKSQSAALQLVGDSLRAYVRHEALGAGAPVSLWEGIASRLEDSPEPSFENLEASRNLEAARTFSDALPSRGVWKALTARAGSVLAQRGGFQTGRPGREGNWLGTFGSRPVMVAAGAFASILAVFVMSPENDDTAKVLHVPSEGTVAKLEALEPKGQDASTTSLAAQQEAVPMVAMVSERRRRTGEEILVAAPSGRFGGERSFNLPLRMHFETTQLIGADALDGASESHEAEASERERYVPGGLRTDSLDIDWIRSNRPFKLVPAQGRKAPPVIWLAQQGSR
ncbi:MAG: hypothetical protein KDD69_13540 [Bdellovibrionales bacterium]|nr:hypothetical protein [Bdellovibrionales bacterium]